MPDITRRLAAVAFADVAGWSRLIEKSDVETLHAWKALRSGLIEPKIREHGGRLLEVAGDAVLVEFPSAVAAVTWAIDVQQGTTDPEQASRFHGLVMRIGVNVEDVIIDDGKLVGNGVNIASRIHQLATPGDIVVTATVRDYVLNKLQVVFSDLGTHELKNIGRPVHIYRVRAAGEEAAPRTDTGERQMRWEGSDAEPSVHALLACEPATADRPGLGLDWQRMVEALQAKVLPIHGGRVLDQGEDRLLLGFPRVPIAVKAAFDIQRICDSANVGLPAARQMQLRIGMQVGETGAYDGMPRRGESNLAGGLTALAGPGEIVVSAGVRDALTPVLDADIEDLGDCFLRALHHPVRAYRVGPPGPRPIIEPSTGDLRPTIAVIPFAARASGPEAQVLGDIVADEIISALSRTADMNVISRLSTSAFRDRAASLEDVSAHLHANYVLSGAYQVADDRLALLVELAEARTGRIVWIDDAKADVASIVEGKDGLIDRIVGEVSAAIVTRELQRAQSQALPTLESYTLLMGAISLMHRLSRYDFDRARELLETLTQRAPRRAVPQAWLAKWHVLQVWQGWSSDPASDARLALECTARALESDAHCSLALVIDGLVHMNLLKQLDVAQERYDTALIVNPNDSLGWLLKGTLHAFKGEGRIAMDDTRRARRLSPLDPLRYYYDSLSATAALSAGKYERAIEFSRRSLRANRTHTSTLRALAIAQWELGRHDEARKTVAELMRLQPTFTISQFLERSPAAAYEIGRTWSEAMRNAGVPG